MCGRHPPLSSPFEPSAWPLRARHHTLGIVTVGRRAGERSVSPLERHRCRTRSKRQPESCWSSVKRWCDAFQACSTASAEDDRKRLLRIGTEAQLRGRATAFQPGRCARRHLSDRVRTHPQLLHAPSGREVTLAYWFPGNFVGAPDMFGGGTHMWGSSAVQRTSHDLPARPELRRLALGVGANRGGSARRLVVQGALLFGHGADARHAIRDRTTRASAGVPGDGLRLEGTRRNRDRCLVHPRRSREPDRLDPTVGDGAARTAAGARRSYATTADCSSSAIRHRSD